MLKNMTLKPKTIDDLGIDASIRYAKDQELLEPRLLSEAQLISNKTTVSVLRPHLPNEFAEKFGFKQQTLWATFSPPPAYFSSSPDLFSYQLIPSLWRSEEMQEQDPVLLVEEGLQRERPQDQSDEEQKEEEEEKKVIVALIECMGRIDQSLELINARRNQYQRG